MPAATSKKPKPVDAQTRCTRSGTAPRTRQTAPAIVAFPPLRTEHKRITREYLISAAEDLFQKQGFRATSIEQIVRAAGTTATTFYRHFKGKTDLAVILQEKVTDEVRAVLERLNAMRQPTKALVRAWIDEYYAMWRRNHNLCDAYWEATLSDPELARNILPATMNLMAQLDGLLERYPKKLRRRGQLRHALQTLLLDRVAYLAECAQTKAEASEVLDEYADILWVSLYQSQE